MKTALFIDDEPHLLSGLEGVLRKLRSEWKMSFALGGKAALELLEKSTFDVVVTDLHMPGTDGLALLDQVKALAPNSVRIVLSGTTDQDSLLRSAAVAHQFLSKPCDPEVLKSILRRAFALRELLRDERLLHVASQLVSLPALPSLYLEIQELLRRPGSSIGDVGRVVAKDVSMSAKVLHLANSAFFGAARTFVNPEEATAYLGLDTITALVLTQQIFVSDGSLKPATLEQLWQYSLRTAAMAREIFRLEGQDSRATNQAFLAGLLHEVGLLVLSRDMPEPLARAWKHAQRFGVSVAESERRMIGASRASIGAHLMGLWGMPDPVVEAIAFRHEPRMLPHTGLSQLTAVHVAAAFVSGMSGGPLGQTEECLDRVYLQELGLVERLPVWREHCHELLQRRAA